MEAGLRRTPRTRAFGAIMFLAMLSLPGTSVSAETSSNGIALPSFKDKYSAYVRQLETGKTDIDYKDFRDSFRSSRQCRLKEEGLSTKYDNLRRDLVAQMKQRNNQGVIKAAKAMLEIDYTSMFAHKYLQQTYKVLGDKANQTKYHDIEFGLLKSIIRSGDGKTCQTAWQVVQVEEEYFILDMLGANLKMQSVSNSNGHVCDKMEVTTNEGDKVYFFGVDKIFASLNESLNPASKPKGSSK